MKLKELRENKSLTQEALGKIVNQSKSTISKYERGALEPNLQTLKEFSRFFGVSIDYLLGVDIVCRNEQNKRIIQAIGDDEELLEFWMVLKKREDLKLMLKQTKDLPASDIKTIFRIIKSFEEENQK